MDKEQVIKELKDFWFYAEAASVRENCTGANYLGMRKKARAALARLNKLLGLELTDANRGVSPMTTPTNRSPRRTRPQRQPGTGQSKCGKTASRA